MTIEWYYTKGNQQFGPVTPVELKKLAEQGDLGSEELVWREGMDEWVPAKRVKGLFEGEGGPALAGPALPSTRSSRTAFERSPAAFERARQRASRHFFDRLLDLARSRFTAQFAALTARLFGLVGHYGLYAAMVAVLAVQGMLTFRTGLAQPILLGSAAVLVLAVLHYAAGRFSLALERLARDDSARMASAAFLDGFALLHLTLGLVALLGFSILAAEADTFGWLLPAVAGFILCQYAAVVALNPETLHLAITSDASPTEETLALLAFFVKLTLRIAPICYGLGAVWGIVLLGYVGTLLLRAPTVELHGSITRMPSLADLVPQSSDPASAGSVASGAVVLLLATVALPILAYFGFLAYRLALDVLRALLALPGASIGNGTEKDE